ncbi:hypothetical protein Tco_0919190 [Tanacetum coccineum]
MLGYHGDLLVPSFETAGLRPETDHLSPSYDLLKKGSFFTRSWASRNKIARSSILGPASVDAEPAAPLTKRGAGAAATWTPSFLLLPALSRVEPEFFIRKVAISKPEGCYPNSASGAERGIREEKWREKEQDGSIPYIEHTSYLTKDPKEQY